MVVDLRFLVGIVWAVCEQSAACLELLLVDFIGGSILSCCPKNTQEKADEKEKSLIPLYFCSCKISLESLVKKGHMWIKMYLMCEEEFYHQFYQ